MKQNEFDLSLIDPILDKYTNVKGSLITILQKTQDTYGYLPEEVILYIAEKTHVKPAKIYGVVTFYTQFRLKPVGKYLIMLCQGTACHVNGSEKIETSIYQELNIKDGETTEDGLFTLNNVACLGCCSLSPVMMINGKVHAKLTPKKTRVILDSLKKEALQKIEEE